MEMNCKRFFLKVEMFFVYLVLLKLLDLLREATKFFFAYRQVLEALKNLTGFQVRKPKLDLKNVS